MDVCESVWKAASDNKAKPNTTVDETTVVKSERKFMIDAQDKISKGVQVYPKVDSHLILGGTDFKLENTINKVRLRSLEEPLKSGKFHL